MAEDVQAFGDWSFGDMTQLGLIWTCAGTTVTSDNSLLLFAYMGSDGNSITQLVYIDGELQNDLPKLIVVKLDSEEYELQAFDYPDRPSNEVAFLPIEYSDAYFSALKKSNSITFTVREQVIGPFSLKGFSSVIDAMQGCFGTSGISTSP